MEKLYPIIGKDDTAGLMRFWSQNGQVLLPLVELIEQSKMAVDDLIDVMGRAPIEAVLRLSADAPRVPLARREEGLALGCRGAARNGKELPQDYGLPESGGAESGLRSQRSVASTGGGVEWPEPSPTSNGNGYTFSAHVETHMNRGAGDQRRSSGRNINPGIYRPAH